LKVAQMLLPVHEHRLAPLAQVTEKYEQTMPLVNENGSAFLGVVGSIGLLILLARPLYRNLPGVDPRLQDALYLLTISAILLATIGGFGSLLCMLASPKVRCYNRISVYIAFFSLMVVVLLLVTLARRLLTTRRRQWAYWGCLGGILIAGILDQAPCYFVPCYDEVKLQFRNDA